MGFKSVFLKRISETFITFMGIVVLIFTLVRVMPGDPARVALGFMAWNDDAYYALREAWRLDEPLHVQFYYWFQDLLRGYWGESVATRRNVLTDVLDFFPATLELVTYSMIFAVVVGVPLGVISATKKDRMADQAARVFSISATAMPQYWTGILAFIVFSLYFKVLPVSGRIDPTLDIPTRITGWFTIDSIITMNSATLTSSIAHLIMPVIILSLPSIAQITRVVRASVLEEKEKDYVLTLRANGLPDGIIVYKYMLKTAFIAALSIIGLTYGTLIGGAFLVESVFGWPGVANLGAQAVLKKDFNLIVGFTIVIGVIILVINFLVEVAYGYLDPRIRHGE